MLKPMRRSPVKRDFDTRREVGYKFVDIEFGCFILQKIGKWHMYIFCVDSFAGYGMCHKDLAIRICRKTGKLIYGFVWLEIVSYEVFALLWIKNHKW